MRRPANPGRNAVKPTPRWACLSAIVPKIEFQSGGDHSVPFTSCPITVRSDRGLPRCARLAAVALLAWLPLAVYAAPYELGQGYPLPILGLTAGGYASVQVYSLEGEKAEATVQDLSLFLHSDPSPAWHFFTEIEVSNPLTLSRDGLATRDVDLDFERFYLDHNLSARTTIRFGKFLTPVGRWNQIHADPLVWTASRPLTTSAAFARNASGLQLYGSWPLGRSAVDYQLYLDDSAQLDPTEGREKTYLDVSLQPNPPSSFRRGGGIRLRYRTFDDALQAGVSLAHFQLKDLPGYKDMVGGDLFYACGDAEFSGEAVYRKDDGGNGGREWGGFAQAVMPLAGHLYGIVSYERYKAELFGEPVESTVLGLTYRPTPPFSVKLERRESRGEERLAPDGWLFSVALLF
jgi:hypothetical protein